MPLVDVEQLRSQVHLTATDPSLDPGERVAMLRRIRDLADQARDQVREVIRGQLDAIESLTALLGSIDTYSGDNELRREADAMEHVMTVARLRENADLRERLIREGGATAEQLDGMGIASHEQLDDMASDGSLHEAAFGLAKNFAEWKVKRQGGRFATQNGPSATPAPAQGAPGPAGGPPGPPAAVSPARTPTPAKPRQRGTQRASGGGARGGPAAATPGAAPPQPAYPVPDKPPQAPKSPGTAEAINRIRSIEDAQAQLEEVAKHGLNDWPEKGKLGAEAPGRREGHAGSPHRRAARLTGNEDRQGQARLHEGTSGGARRDHRHLPRRADGGDTRRRPCDHAQAAWRRAAQLSGEGSGPRGCLACTQR